MSPVDFAESLIKNPNKKRVHMLGIGGIGMAGLARLLHDRGLEVSGCDAQENAQTRWLSEKGVSIQIGHNSSHITNEIDWVIRTTAVPDSHIEVATAKSLEIPVLRRGEVLPALLRSRKTIAVSGTHGKTTTSSLIAQVLKSCGVECGWCIGGEVPGLDGVAGDGEWMVVEADESDGTAALYSPEIAVITNIEYDHMEHHANADSFVNVFRQFAKNAKKVVYCSEDKIASEVCESLENATDYFLADDFSIKNFALLGRHNLLNASAVCKVAEFFGIEKANILKALGKVKAPLRRFEIVSEKDGVTIVSDYAHHPTEIRCLIQSAKELNPKRIIAVFQPHRYTRTLALGEDFPPAFEGIDKLFLVPVYAASEAPIDGGTTLDLINRFDSSWSQKLTYSESIVSAWNLIKKILKPGDLLLIVGAGDIVKIADLAK